MPKPKAQSLDPNPVILEVVQLPIGQLEAHPQNPRPWSETYGIPVYDDKVEELILLISEQGFDVREPLQVIQLASQNYQIVIGHHRFAAARALNHKTVPCLVLPPMAEVDAALMLVSRQGREVEPWQIARHAWHLCSRKELPQTEYSRRTGFSVKLVSKWVRAMEVRQATSCSTLSISGAAAIARADEEHWAELVRKAEGNNWNVRQIEDAASALNQAPEPPSLSWDEQAAPAGQGTLHMEQTLEIDRPAVPSPQPISAITTASYPPQGLEGMFSRWVWGKNDPASFDLIIMDRSLLPEAPFAAIPICAKLLKKGGRAIILCEPNQIYDVQAEAEAVRMDVEQKLVWYKGVARKEDLELNLWPSCYSDILVLSNGQGKDPSYCGLEDVARANLASLQDLIKLNHKGTGFPALLAETLIRAYCPPKGKLLNPYADDGGVIALAGARLSRQVVWMTSDHERYERLDRLCKKLSA